MKRKSTALLLTLALVLTAVMAGCSKSNSGSSPSPSASASQAETSTATPSETASAAPKEEKTITFATITNYYTDGLKQAAADYQKLHPETTVKIDIATDNATYRTSFQAKMAAGGDDAPDIVHSNILGDTPANNINKGFIIKMNDYVKQPNPYNNNVSLWDGVNGDYWPYAYTSNGDVFMVPFDLVGTGFYYNQKIFAEAGIAEVPTSWEDLFVTLQKLKDANTIPLAMSQATGSDLQEWMVATFVDWAASPLIPDMIVMPGEARNTPEVEAINAKVKYSVDNPFFDVGAIFDEEKVMTVWKSGKYDNQGPAEQKYWSALKQLSTYLQPGYSTMSDADAYQLFISGKAAVYWNGSWQVGQILKDQKALGDKQFAWGTFKFPDWKTPDPNFPGHPRGILTPGHTLAITNKKDTELAERAKDFLHFLYSPTEAQKVYLTTIEAGQFVQGPSLVKGVVLPDEVNAYLDGFKVAGNKRNQLNWLANGNPANEPNAIDELKVLQLQYYGGKLTLEEFLKKKAEFVTKTNEKFIAKGGFDLDPKTKP